MEISCKDKHRPRERSNVRIDRNLKFMWIVGKIWCHGNLANKIIITFLLVPSQVEKGGGEEKTS